MHKLAVLCLGLTLAFGAMAEEGRAATLTGVGQADPVSATELGRLKLDQPLVAEKYKQSPDLLRFLRATYSEACSRGVLAQALNKVRLSPAEKQKPEVQDLAARLLDGKRIWKMSTFELEVVFGENYLRTANYCDCLMLEVSDNELVNPKRGMDVIENLPENRLNLCNAQAKEKTAEQVKRFKGNLRKVPGL